MINGTFKESSGFDLTTGPLVADLKSCRDFLDSLKP